MKSFPRFWRRAWPFAIALLLALPTFSAAAPFNEFTRADLAVGSQNSVAIADFNGDGNADMAMAFYTSSVTLLFGKGDGTFGPATTVPAGVFQSEGVITADVNADGKPDLLVGDQGSSTISVLLGNGDGTFAAPRTFTTSGFGKFIRVGDFNRDGRLDVATAAGNAALVRLGNGDGTFGPEVSSPVTGCAASAEFLAADFNEDGLEDLAILNPCPYGKVSILLGNGDGSFQPQIDTPVSAPFFCDAGDLNGDGHLDLAVSESGGDHVSILLGHGDGTFDPATATVVGWDPAGVRIGDLNADGFLDVAVTSHSTSAVYLLAGHGDGIFDAPLGVATARAPYSLQEGDLKTDGRPDLVTPVVDVNPPVGGLTLLLNSTGPTIGNAPVVTAPDSIAATEGVTLTFTVTATDPDGDRILRLLDDVSLAGRTFTVNAQNTSGTYSWTPSFGTARPDPYYVVFTARNELVGQAIVRIFVSRPVSAHAPVLTQPADMTTNEGVPADQTLTATDADGDPLTFTKTTGPGFMTVTTLTPGTGSATGNVHLAPGYSDAGTYPATVRVSDYGLYDEKSFTITIIDVPGAPVLAPIANMTVYTGQTADQSISATDPDGDAITFTSTGPPFMTVTSNVQSGTTRTGNIHLAPTSLNGGFYPASVTASSGGLSDTRSFTISVIQTPDRPPVVTAPVTASGPENALLTFTVSAADPDGDAIVSLSAAPLPPGSTFTVNAANTSGTFSWTPSFTQSGSYNVTFTASNSLSGSATTAITIGGVDRAPVVAAPATASGPSNVLLTFTVTAADPDGDVISTLTAAPLPPGATFASNVAHTSGTFAWTPTDAQSGVWPVTFTASNALSGSATTTMTVSIGPRPPVVAAPSTVSGSENSLISFVVTAADADASLTSLTASPLPAGATFSADPSFTSGTFSWIPTYVQSGTYGVQFTATNSAGLSGSALTSISVANVDRPPIANAGPDQSGVVDVPLAFDGSASADPDGTPLAYAWDFGDGSTAAGATVSHTFTSSGTFHVTLTVTSGGLSGSDTALATIAAEFSAIAFTVGGNGTIALNSGKPYACVQIQPSGAFTIDAVNLSTIRMQYPVGSTNQIFADPTKTAVTGDKNKDGVEEITACFRKTDLRALFGGLPAGSNTVTVDLRGELVTGGGFHATLSLIVKSTGALAAVIAPNPLNPRAQLSFVTSRGGRIRVRMFDPQGRLLNTLADGPVDAGFHSIVVDGRSASGSKLASGIYLLRIWTEFDGEETKNVTILK